MQRFDIHSGNARLPVNFGSSSRLTNLGPGTVSYADSDEDTAQGTLAPAVTVNLSETRYLWADATATVRVEDLTVGTDAQRLEAVESTRALKANLAVNVGDYASDFAPYNTPLDKAISILGVNGGTIQIPRGPYTHTAQLNLQGKAHIEFVGEGHVPGLSGGTSTNLNFDCNPGAKAFTVAAATDLLTVTAHGYAAGNAVVISQLTGGTGLATKTIYWTRDVTANTFKLAATSGGAAIDVTADGSGTIARLSDNSLINLKNGAKGITFRNLSLVNISDAFAGYIVDCQNDTGSGANDTHDISFDHVTWGIGGAAVGRTPAAGIFLANSHTIDFLNPAFYNCQVGMLGRLLDSEYAININVYNGRFQNNVRAHVMNAGCGIASYRGAGWSFNGGRAEPLIFTTTLAEPLDAVETAIDVAAAAPVALQTGTFPILVDSEVMLVTAGAATTTWTVTRGASGTTAAAHDLGATMTNSTVAGFYKHDPGVKGDILNIHNMWFGDATSGTGAQITWAGRVLNVTGSRLGSESVGARIVILDENDCENVWVVGNYCVGDPGTPIPCVIDVGSTTGHGALTSINYKQGVTAEYGGVAIPTTAYEMGKYGLIFGGDISMGNGGGGVLDLNGHFRTGAGKSVIVGGALDHDGTSVGFYGTVPIVKQTGVAVTAAGIHAALVNLGLIAA